MKIQVLESKPTKLTFLMKDSESSVANAIRRCILGEVPVMAINDVTVYENTSVLIDEYIAHRLAMVPLTTDLKNYKRHEECCGGNCSSCSVEFTLDESGPKTVYSSDMKTSDSKIKPVSGKIPIAELNAGQRLRLEAKAVLGTGETHAKWQVGNASYKYMSEVSIDDKCTNCQECVKACPKGVFKKGKDKPKIEDVLNCNACEKCVEVCAVKAVKVKQDESTFVFKVETEGQLPAKEVVRQAIDIVKGKVDAMKDCLKK